jgi:hypothetical protein
MAWYLIVFGINGGSIRAAFKFYINHLPISVSLLSLQSCCLRVRDVPREPILKEAMLSAALTSYWPKKKL